MSSYLIPFIQTGIANSSNTANTSNTANYANFAGNVVNASQPNITSVGSLSSLEVTGTSNIANLNANGIVNFNGSNVSLGSVSNLHIDGGTNGYVLQTDGVGNLTWVAQTGGGGGNGTPGGSNTQIQYNNAGNFAGAIGFTFNNVTSNIQVPQWINSGLANNSAYLIGLQNNNIPITSMVLGNIFAPIRSQSARTIRPGNSYQTNNMAYISGNVRTNNYSSVFTANAQPGMAVINAGGFSNTAMIPIVYNNDGNSNIAIYFGNLANSSFSNITSAFGGIKDTICCNISGASNFAFVGTNNNQSNLRLGVYTGGFSGISNLVLPNANYHPTGVKPWFSNTIICAMNKDNFTDLSQYIIVEYAPTANITASGIIGTVNNYSRFADYFTFPVGGTSTYDILYSSWPGSGLGKIAIRSTMNPPTFIETNLPTVTPNATTSYVFDCKYANIGEGSKIYLSCYDNSNSASNTYFVTGTIAGNYTVTFNTTVVAANAPTSFDGYYSNTRNKGVMVGIKNPLDGSNAYVVMSHDYGNSWYSANVSSESITSNLTDLGSNAFTSMKLVSVTAVSNISGQEDNITMFCQATSSQMDLGIPNISNISYNSIKGNAVINDARMVFRVLGDPDTPNIYLDDYNGIYKNLGYTGPSGTNNKALWVKTG
jgi:hypothetical protein